MGRTTCLRLSLLATVATFVFAIPASGQEEPQQQAEQETATDNGGLLDQITIVASKFDEEVIQSLTSTSVVGKDKLQQKQPTNIGQVLNGIPGVSTAGSQDRTGLGTSINIRGLQDFGRVAMITDGARNNFSRADHGSASSMWIEPEMLKQVTVVRGPVANIYGSGAIGGVVVFETKSASDFLRDGEQYGGSIKGGYETNGEGYLTSVTGAIKPVEAFDLIGNFTYRERDDYKGGDGHKVDDTNYEVMGGLAKTVIRPADGHEVTLGWLGNSNDWREPGSIPQDTDLREDIFTGKYHYTPGNGWIDFTLSGYVNDTKMDQTSLADGLRWDQENGGFVNVPAGSVRSFDLVTNGFDVNNTSRFDTAAVRHTLTYGGDWFEDDVTVEDPLGGAFVYNPSGKREVWGAFIQDKLEFSDWLEIIGGLRYDSYNFESTDGEISNDGDRLSPRITAGIKPFESTGLRGLQVYGTYAEGYRSPSVIETLITGMHPAGVAFPFLPNPNLTPETAHMFEVGVNYKRDGIFTDDDGVRVKAAVYHNTVNDYIGLNDSLSPFPGPNFDPNCTWSMQPGTAPFCVQYQNFDEVVLKGIEFEAVYDRGTFFTGLSGSFVDSKNKEDGKELDTVPPDQLLGFLGFRFFDQRLTVGGEVQHAFSYKYSVPDLSTPSPTDTKRVSEDYTLVNLFAGYEVTPDFRVDARLENIFDEKHVNYLSAVLGAGGDPYLEPGFNAKISATWRFGG
ncbi:TonB-dependent hemoglobin/transferrin/lactoferrin family receptor [Taklimakanibacter lacteus]|uniref:TonB-dependent hemoglobin/transferrin/lactoferrin family receptor n=1 Tax=Taklimakanibacter lacteus TaxID=2268456 RepID=UPI000E676313